MECNRDEAVRAKSIAERKLNEKDFVGAKVFAKKAQTLCPDLDGISELLKKLSVSHDSSDNKFDGDIPFCPMECNKDEALRAKSIAEKKLKERDLGAAAKFARKAQKLCPDLDGITQLLKRIGVNDSSDNKSDDGGIPFNKEDCNRDEAVRVKSIAEKKLEENDFVGARKFAKKAQDLCPGLDSISQFRTTIDVYEAAAECNKINGEVDWYRVLGVCPDSDYETIRKQYNKMVFVHPDKNRSFGAKGAFILIKEAWNLLSDETARKAYDRKIGRESR